MMTRTVNFAGAATMATLLAFGGRSIVEVIDRAVLDPAAVANGLIGIANLIA
jgi:hypothetical protein